jgi:hypothetical protein
LNSETTQGTVLGRGTGGSAVAVLGDPICKPGDGICPNPLMAAIRMMVSMNGDNEDRFP